MLSVLKVGGSVLRDDASYAATAGFLKGRLSEHADERLVVIVSAQYGATDALLAEAEALTSEPEHHALDLLWCTGELRSVALLALHLQRIGVKSGTRAVRTLSPSPRAWRNWQTRETQNLVRITPSVGSIPSSGTTAK